MTATLQQKQKAISDARRTHNRERWQKRFAAITGKEGRAISNANLRLLADAHDLVKMVEQHDETLDHHRALGKAARRHIKTVLQRTVDDDRDNDEGEGEPIPTKEGRVLSNENLRLVRMAHGLVDAMHGAEDMHRIGKGLLREAKGNLQQVIDAAESRPAVPNPETTGPNPGVDDRPNPGVSKQAPLDRWEPGDEQLSAIRIAWHESGHAAAAILMGAEIHALEAGASRGRCHADTAVLSAELNAAYSLAGIAAEKAFLPPSISKNVWAYQQATGPSADGSDLRKAMPAVKGLAGCQTVVDRLAEELFGLPSVRAAVRKLFDVLRRQPSGKLPGSQVHDIVTRAVSVASLETGKAWPEVSAEVRSVCLRCVRSARK